LNTYSTRIKTSLPLTKWLADPFTLATLAVYVLALIGLFLAAGTLRSALLLGLGTALLSGIAVTATRGHRPPPVDVIRPQAELWPALVWYGVVFLLAVLTSAGGLEVVNQFTNWLFLVMVPAGLLMRVRGGRLALRATLRSVGLTRRGLKEGLKVAAIVGPLTVPVVYVVGEQQRAAIDMMLRQPLQTMASFLVSFALALLTAGIVEEFFFRGVLQSRLASHLGSKWRGLVIASFLFGLFHLPMCYYSPYEPAHGNLVWALASVIVEQGAMGVLLGVLWARTHHLAAPLLIHALINGLAWMTTAKIGGI
jgi:membrane protease YdiL (CAAX protease family)